MKAFSLPEGEIQQIAKWPVHGFSLGSASSNVCFLWKRSKNSEIIQQWPGLH